MNASYLALRTKEERDQLIEQYLPLVSHLVGRIAISPPPGLDRDDLYSCGVMGLIHAADSYDPRKGASFKTYAYTAVRGAILDELRRADPVPRAARERIRRLDRASRELSSALGRKPTRSELCAELELTEKELDDAFELWHAAHTLSLNGGQDGDDDPGISESQIESDEIPRPLDVAEFKEDVDRLSREIGSLPPQASQVVILYYYEGLLLKEIGAVLGVSESRVCQILSKALAQLRLAMEA